MDKAGTITAALEDYLEAIFNLCRFDRAARSRDIAESLNVHKSTVTAALKSLGSMRLINYAPYEAVTLTPEGRRVAEDVVKRHAALKDFFVNVLKVDADMAETAACGMEHAIPREIVDKLARFAQSMYNCPRLEGKTVDRAKMDKSCSVCVDADVSAAPAPAVAVADETLTSLDQIVPGRAVRIVSVKGGGDIKKRLTEMGLVRGTIVTVERVAPMGDPMDVRVKGYHLSLRRVEAARIVVSSEGG